MTRNNKTTFKRAEVKHKITSDFVLDLYEKAKEYPEGDERDAFLATVKVLSERLGEYLITVEEDD